MQRTLRRLTAASAATMVAALTLSASAGAATTTPQTTTVAQGALSAAVLGEITAFRTARSLRPVTLSRPLTVAAARQSRSMAVQGFFAHESSDGSAFWKRIARSYPSTGYASWSVGENLLWGQEVDAPRALELWVASPPHLANLLDPKWREIGISSVRAHAAPGVFGGQDVTIISTDFGTRAR
jgi:uncharacterized protein YkwD